MSDTQNTEQMPLSMEFESNYIQEGDNSNNIEEITETLVTLQNEGRTNNSNDSNSKFVLQPTINNNDIDTIGEDMDNCNENEPLSLNIGAEEKYSSNSNDDTATQIDMHRNENNHATCSNTCSLFLTTSIWTILIIYILSWIVNALDYVSWIIFFVIPLYVIHLIECFVCSSTLSYLTNVKSANDTKQYINALLECPPTIDWTIVHYHSEKIDKGGRVDCITHTDHRRIHYETWRDDSVYFNVHDLDRYPFIKLQITTFDIDIPVPGFMDMISREYYNDAYEQSLKLTKKRDKQIKINRTQHVERLFDTKILVKHDGPGNEDWRLRRVCYSVCGILVLSYFYSTWVDSKCVRREIKLGKTIKLNQKFPYCFDTNLDR